MEAFSRFLQQERGGAGAGADAAAAPDADDAACLRAECGAKAEQVRGLIEISGEDHP